MEKVANFIFSMRMMALAMIIFFVAIGSATIIESLHGIQAAKIMIYNATWFEILLVFLALNLIANIFRYNMFQREKMALLSFHLSFIIIIAGAAVTRYVGFEGLMMIREGEKSNVIYLSDPHLYVKVHDYKMEKKDNRKLFLSEVTNNDYNLSISDFPGHASTIKIDYVDFKAKQIDTLLIDKKFNTHVLNIVTNGKQANYLSPNNFIMLGDLPISYNKKNSAPGIDIIEKGGKLLFTTKVAMQYLPMSKMKAVREGKAMISDSMYVKVPTDSLVELMPTTLYMVQGQQFVFNGKIPHAKMTKMSSGKKDVGVDVLTLRISDGGKSKEVILEGGMGQLPTYQIFQFNGLVYEMGYGSTEQKIPFFIACRDFQLDRYPGSEVASSFASEVTILDGKNNVTKDKRIFMNHVMDYGGYRFFQSSYDLDDPQTPENEEGTRLSVNYDFWGTNITYVGYLLMAIGMVLSLFARNGRFKELLGKIAKSHERQKASISMIAVFLLISGLTQAQQPDSSAHNHNHEHEHDHAHEPEEAPSTIDSKTFYVMSEAFSDEFASLLVQDFKGRIVPAHTVCDELLRKIYGKNRFSFDHKSIKLLSINFSNTGITTEITENGLNAVQAVMSMHMFPAYWETQDIIAVPKAVRERLKLKDYASFKELTGENNEFKWLALYDESHHKLESKRSEFDKKIIKLVEKYQVVSSIFSWQYMKFIPRMDDKTNTWSSPFDMNFTQKDQKTIQTAGNFLRALFDATKNNKYGKATDFLTDLKQIQRRVGKKVVPSETHVKLEISYNKMGIFKNSMNSYFAFGMILLIVFFIRIFKTPTEKSEKRFRRIGLIFNFLIGIIFLYHAYGLGMRWYISGHAPWSNGYEAMVFIAWVSVLAGFIFSKKNPVVLAGTCILAYFILFVSELNLLDPEITPLQPVLKSYWLQIHVSIITGSYGFLGMGAILGLINLLLYIFRSKSNGARLTANINEITYVSELTITIGLFMLTIGTFLGGVWANESWGRYWGWDPKETWALVSVLVYAVILHLRYIPGLAGKFTFNLVSLWGYGAILFTFFGVNFYLVGLHSYAQGEGLPEIPSWLFYTIGIFVIFSVISFVRFKMYQKTLKDDLI